MELNLKADAFFVKTITNLNISNNYNPNPNPNSNPDKQSVYSTTTLYTSPTKAMGKLLKQMIRLAAI